MVTSTGKMNTGAVLANGGVPVKSILGHVLAGRALPGANERVMTTPVVAGDTLTVQYIAHQRVLKTGCKRKRIDVRTIRLVTCWRRDLPSGDFRWEHAASIIVKV